MKSYIYKILNTKTKDFYIGSTANVDKRWKEHKKFLNGNRHHSRHLQNAWNKYSGWVFEFEIVEACEINKLIEREQFYIDTLKPRYNIRQIAHSQLGLKRTDEAKLNMRNSRLGKKHSEETIEKIRLRSIGNKSNTGRKLTVEHKRNLKFSKKFCNLEILGLMGMGV